MKTANKGFTLIELLVVIAIIGILAGMVLVSMGGARAKARDAKRQSDMRQIISAQEMMYGTNSKYFVEEDADAEGSVIKDTNATYLTIPSDPGGGEGVACVASPVSTTAYKYNYCTIPDSSGATFCYFATLEQAIKVNDIDHTIVVASETGSGLRTNNPTATDCVPN